MFRSFLDYCFISSSHCVCLVPDTGTKLNKISEKSAYRINSFRKVSKAHFDKSNFYSSTNKTEASDIFCNVLLSLDFKQTSVVYQRVRLG